MTKVNELKDDELKTVSGGVSVNGIEYKYSIGTKLICCGENESIIAEILDHAVINGAPAYLLDATKNFLYSSESETMQATLEEAFLDKAGYVPYNG